MSKRNVNQWLNGRVRGILIRLKEFCRLEGVRGGAQRQEEEEGAAAASRLFCNNSQRRLTWRLRRLSDSHCIVQQHQPLCNNTSTLQHITSPTVTVFLMVDCLGLRPRVRLQTQSATTNKQRAHARGGGGGSSTEV